MFLIKDFILLSVNIAFRLEKHVFGILKEQFLWLKKLLVNSWT